MVKRKRTFYELIAIWLSRLHVKNTTESNETSSETSGAEARSERLMKEKALAASLTPLPERQLDEQNKLSARLAHLSYAVEAERQHHETFKPKINTSGPFADKIVARTPLTERTNIPQSQKQPPPLDANATFKPQINSVSTNATIDEVRSHVSDLHSIRKRVQALWSIFAEDSSMSGGQAVKALREIGITDSVTVGEFLAALDIVPDDDTKRSVDYSRFSKVFNAALKAAMGPSSSPPQQVQTRTNPTDERPRARCSPPEPHYQGASMRRASQYSPPGSTPPQHGLAATNTSQTPGRLSHPPTIGVSRAKPLPVVKARVHPPRRSYDPMQGCTFAPSINTNIDTTQKTPCDSHKGRR